MDQQKLAELRRRAQERLCSENHDYSGDSRDEVLKLLHELHTYQIELEMQNEELLRVQEELVATRDQYIDLYDFAPVGYLTLSDEGLIVEANLTATVLLGEERKSLRGQPFFRFIFHDDQDIFYKLFRKIIASMDRMPADLRVRRKDGDQFWARLECVPRTTSESGTHIRIALQDITEAKHLENEIMQTKKLEATALLVGGIAHDFNNLLAVILGNLEIAQEDMSEGRPVADIFQDARDACLSAADLTKKFLTFSTGGKPSKKLTAIEALITDSVSLALAGSNIGSEYSFPDGLWPVEVDAGQITLAIGNVITNAREAMPQGGVIRIQAENTESIFANREIPSDPAAKYVKVSIQDQGVGIPREFIPRVFDPYFTSKDSWHEKGLGLGLTVAHSILKKHGGFIDIASQQDAGTTVSFYLPASDRQIALQQSKSRKTRPVNKKILFMDDEKMLRTMTRHLLGSLGYEVEVACDGEEAIQAFSKARRSGSPFGAVILDLTIKGGMGGREAIRHLRELDPDIIAIVVSGYSDDPVMANFKEYGFDDALPKPYQLPDLEKSLERMIGMPS